MSRIDLPSATKEQVILSKIDFLADWERGYCAIEIFPEREDTLVDPRTRRELKVKVQQTVSLRCMKCMFDVVDSALNKMDGKPRTATDVMIQHLQLGKHHWPYRPFTNPYGHDADIMIEGIENYAIEIGDM